MPADTFSSDGIGFQLMGTGNDNNNWGNNQNSNVFQVLSDAIANALTTTASGGALGPSNILDLSGSPPPAAVSQAHWAGLVFTGAITANQTVKVPNFNKWWWVSNQTTGAFTVTIKTPSGSASTAIPQNSGWQVVQCDGANNIIVSPFNTAQVQMGDGTLGAPAYSNVNESTSGWRRAGTQDWRLTIAGADVLQVTGTGASSPSIVNILSPQTLEFAGTAFNPTAVAPTGQEACFAGINPPTGWVLEYGQAVARGTAGSTYNALFNVICPNTIGGTALTGTPSNGSPTITGVNVDLRNLGVEGAFIEGTGITTGATIVSVTSNSITLSINATGGSSAEALRILPYGQGDGSTTFNIPNRRGKTLFGRDNMGGTAAGILTGATSGGIVGTKLSATGGEEAHTLLSPSELPSHAHTTAESAHSHNIQGSAATPGGSGGGSLAVVPFHTGGSQSYGSTETATTGLTINATGSSGAHNTTSPGGVTNWIIKL